MPLEALDKVAWH